MNQYETSFERSRVPGLLDIPDLPEVPGQSEIPGLQGVIKQAEAAERVEAPAMPVAPGQPAYSSGRPTAQQLEMALRRLEQRTEIRKSILNAIGVLIVIAAIVVLALTLWLPIFQVQRGSMTPTLIDGDVIIFNTAGKLNRGNVVAFHYGNQVLIKRIIAMGGDKVNINEDGRVYINDSPIDEPYVQELNLGECDIKLPLIVPDGQYFVMGDHRRTSLDSRSEEIGLIQQDQMIGKALLRIWPLDKLAIIN